MSTPHNRPARKRPGLALMLPLLGLLLTACATRPVPPPAVPAVIPPLPVEARQSDSPTYSQRLSERLNAWRLLLTGPSSQD
jgi:hypothetical protein